MIILGGDEGYTNAPPDDPGWDNVGYVRANWANVQSRASGVYIGDGWVLTAYHVLYYDAPTGIVFNAEPNKAYPIDVESYIRLDTTNSTRFADSTHWVDPRDYPDRTEWMSALNTITTNGADLAMFQLTENPDIDHKDPPLIDQHRVEIDLVKFRVPLGQSGHAFQDLD